MKKAVIIFVFTILSFHSEAQQTLNSVKEVDILLNEILSLTKNKYTFTSTDSAKGLYKFSFFYSDGTHSLTVRFYRISRGGSYDLGIPDTMSYRLADIRGFYQDVFPFWKKHYAFDADLEKTTKEGSVYEEKVVADGEIFFVIFSRVHPLWNILILTEKEYKELKGINNIGY